MLASQEMPGARWFPGVQLNYAEHVLRERDPDALAVHHASELRPLEAWSWGELRKRVSAIAGGPACPWCFGGGPRCGLYAKRPGDTCGNAGNDSNRRHMVIVFA